MFKFLSNFNPVNLKIIGISAAIILSMAAGFFFYAKITTAKIDGMNKELGAQASEILNLKSETLTYKESFDIIEGKISSINKANKKLMDEINRGNVEVSRLRNELKVMKNLAKNDPAKFEQIAKLKYNNRIDCIELASGRVLTEKEKLSPEFNKGCAIVNGGSEK